MSVPAPSREHLMHSNSWLEPGARGIDEVEWHMWQTRQWPFCHVNPGDTFFVVSGGGIDEGTVVSENRMDHLVLERYSSIDEAWKLLQGGIPKEARGGLTMARFLSSDYTQSAPTSGWLMAFASKHLRDINAPRPVGFKFRPNGWGRYAGDL